MCTGDDRRLWDRRRTRSRSGQALWLLSDWPPVRIFQMARTRTGRSSQAGCMTAPDGSLRDCHVGLLTGRSPCVPFRVPSRRHLPQLPAEGGNQRQSRDRANSLSPQTLATPGKPRRPAAKRPSRISASQPAFTLEARLPCGSPVPGCSRAARHSQADSSRRRRLSSAMRPWRQ